MVSLVRSSAAEYLTFVAAGGNSEASVEMRYEDEGLDQFDSLVVEGFGWESDFPLLKLPRLKGAKVGVNRVPTA